MTGQSLKRIPYYIEHILAAIGRIETYVEGLEEEGFSQDTLVQDAVIRNLEVIGEAANKIQTTDPDFAQRHSELRLDLAYRMRNALIHGYDSVNVLTIWNTIQADLPVLKRQMYAILKL